MDNLMDVSKAKDSYELAITILSILIGTIAWGVKLSVKKNDEHIKQCEDIHKEYNGIIFKLVEAHRDETMTALQRINNTLAKLSAVIEKCKMCKHD